MWGLGDIYLIIKVYLVSVFFDILVLILDREIISILNRGTKLKISKELFSQETTEIIIKHIQKRLATLSKSRYGKMELKEIIFIRWRDKI